MEILKTCNKCNVTQNNMFFNKHKTGKHGTRPYCKSCERYVQRDKRQRNIASWKLKDKKYYTQHREKILARRSQYYKNNKQKIRAHEQVKKALYNGTIERSVYCEHCHNVQSQVAHHEDYNFPLVVVWLCYRCHMILHHGK